MKILVVTNLYPPHHLGGYELGCRDIVEKLRARGHTVRVLTSNFRNGEMKTPDEAEVGRVLQFNAGPSDPPHDKRAECGRLAHAVNSFSPDVVYFSNQAGLCQWLPVVARRRGDRTAFFLSDTSFVSWRVGAWLAGAAKNNLLLRAIFGKTFLVRGWPVVQNRPCHFTSGFLRDVAKKSGITIAEKNSAVTHWGIDPAQFPAVTRERWPVRRLLFVGRLSPQKGVHTALTAVSLLAKEKEFSGLTFSLAVAGRILITKKNASAARPAWHCRPRAFSR